MFIKGFEQYFKIYEFIKTDKFQIIPEGSSIPTSGVVKFGVDPTGPELHLGHLIPILMVKKLKDNGMDVHIVLGSMTAMLGDPSGRNTMRPMLTLSQTKSNADKILIQIKRILGNDITIHYNHEWFEKMTLPDMIQILSKYTVDYLMSRDAFQKRKEEGGTIGMHELIVPILQGLDSVELKANVEVGGTDQLFNFLLSREVQTKSGQAPEICILSPIINGTDGRKMSKSFGNCIFINDTPTDVFGKCMSISDTLMHEWYPLFVDSYDNKQHPMELKKNLAVIVTNVIWGEGKGEEERSKFERNVQSKNVPTDIKEYPSKDIVEFIRSITNCSRGEARRLMAQNAVSIDGNKITDNEYVVKPGETVKVGKRNYGKAI